MLGGFRRAERLRVLLGGLLELARDGRLLGGVEVALELANLLHGSRAFGVVGVQPEGLAQMLLRLSEQEERPRNSDIGHDVAIQGAIQGHQECNLT